MKFSLVRLLFPLMLITTSCTSEVLTFKRCTGGFTLIETIPCGKRASIIIDATSNIRAGTADGVVDSVGPTESRASVWGTLDDPCQDGEIGYSFVCNGRPYTRTVAISANGVIVDAPINVRATANGTFSYDIEVRCCREDVRHTLETRSPAAMIIDLAPVQRALPCEQTETVTITGKLVRPQGGYVDVTITGPNGTCTTTTNVLGQD